ncbi:hypothetical protein Mapa_013089 [Marchantia paleacea]|nr:hypothetical protein Mapa_013089 [Marchantia paleacea]
MMVMMLIDVAAGDQAFCLPPALLENHTTDSDTLQPRRADKNIFGFSYKYIISPLEGNRMPLVAVSG